MSLLDSQPYQTQPGRAMIVADVFPADVTFEWIPQTVTKTRFVMTQAGTVYIFVDGTTGPELLYSGVALSTEGSPKDIKVTTSDGVLTSVKTGGCGCGSRLRGFRPFEQSIHVS